jgi:geranylgeranyl diphosphate synthase type II
MLIRLLNTCTSNERDRIVGILHTPRSSKRERHVVWMRLLLDKYDCLDYARQYAHGLAGAAAHEYSGIFGHLPDSRDKRFIEGLVTWVFERT